MEAGLAAETGSAAFRVALGHWAGAAENRDLRDVIHDTLTRLRTLTAAGTPSGVGSAASTRGASTPRRRQVPSDISERSRQTW
ncbi:hypothetical protein GCM10010510_25200 [Streptomyces anandii JCM 4720]|nr:hypothetical protein GCM10010510_25200 [Streptomyces anandii JCM 4720]